MTRNVGTEHEDAEQPVAALGHARTRAGRSRVAIRARARNTRREEEEGGESHLAALRPPLRLRLPTLAFRIGRFGGSPLLRNLARDKHSSFLIQIVIQADCIAGQSSKYVSNCWIQNTEILTNVWCSKARRRAPGSLRPPFLSRDIHTHIDTPTQISSGYKLHTVPICYFSTFYKLAWAWAWVV